MANNSSKQPSKTQPAAKGANRRWWSISLAFVLAIVAAGAIAYSSQRMRDDKSDLVFESVYNYLIVARNGNIVRFRRMENGATVSAIDLSNPKRQVITYTGALFAAALAKSNPKNVLNIGLGAGAFNRLFEPMFPDAKLITIEIDPMILKIAASYTDFRQSPSNKVILDDGRRYITRAFENWDWVVLDAFVRNSQVPFHLTTVEFYKLIFDHLSADGVVVTNLHSGNLLYQSHIRTLRKVFPQVILVSIPEMGNVIAIGAKYATPDLLQAVADTNVKSLPDLKPWGVDFAAFKKMVSDAANLDLTDRAPLLTDDFAPVEYLDLKSK